jgi:hypothetical protein
MTRGTTALAFVLGGVLSSRGALAQTKEECVDAYDKAQRLRQEGKLRASKAQLQICSRAACPAVAQKDCVRWLEEVTRAIPMVVATAKDEAGHDTDAVRLWVDDELMAERLDGRALEIDPGAHTFRYEFEGRTMSERVVLPEGEHRRLVADFTKVVAPAPPKSAPPVAPKDKEEPETRRGLPAGAIVLGVASAGFLVGFAAFGLAGKGKESCVPNCTHDEYDAFKRDYLLADISLGLSIVSAGAALWIALSRPSAPSPRAADVWLPRVRYSLE